MNIYPRSPIDTNSWVQTSGIRLQLQPPRNLKRRYRCIRRVPDTSPGPAAGSSPHFPSSPRPDHAPFRETQKSPSRALKVIPTGPQTSVLTSLLRFRDPGWAMVDLGSRSAEAREHSPPLASASPRPLNGGLFGPKFLSCVSEPTLELKGHRR